MTRRRITGRAWSASASRKTAGTTCDPGAPRHLTPRMTRSSTRRAPLSPTHAATLEISPLARALARRQATHHTRASGYYATAQSACRKITTSVGSYRRRTERRQRSRYEMEAATLVPGERVLDHLISVARDAGVRAPQLRHTPNQKSVTDAVRDSAAGNTGASSPQDPKGWGVATSERNDATLARARRGREGGDSAQSGAGALVTLGLRSSPRTRTYEGGPE